MRLKYPYFDGVVIFLDYCVHTPAGTTLRKGDKQRSEVKELGKSETCASSMTTE